MKCFNHEDREAVGTCQHCGKTLCKECASKHTPCLCEECFATIQQEKQAVAVNAENARKQKYIDALVDTQNEFIKTCVLGVIVSAILMFMAVRGGDYTLSETIFTAVLLFFIPFGWKLITYLQSFIPLVIIGSIWFWIFWIMFKAIASVYIGIPAFIYQLIKTFFASAKKTATQKDIKK